VGWWPLTPLALAMFLVAIAGKSVPAGAALGLCFGLAFFVPHLSWSGIYVGPLPWLALAALQALYVAAFGGAAVLGLRCPGGHAVRALTVAGLWVAQEALRSRTPFGGFPWGRLAFSQADAPTLGLAAVGGAPLVSFAVALAGVLLAQALLQGLRFHERRDAVRRSGTPGTSAAAVLAAAAVMAAGALVPPAVGGRPVTVAAVQGNVARPGLEFNAERRAVLDNHAKASRDLAAAVATGGRPAPDLVLWPENASDIDPLRNADAAAVISRAVEELGVPVLVGAVLQEPPGRLRNVSLVWDPRSGPGARYVKRRPVPFAEYVPYRSFFRRITDKVDLVPRDFVAGRGPNLLRVGPAAVGTAICFEVALDDLLREAVRGGADLLAVQTNNATFGRTDESVQQLAMSRLRAVEHGRAVAHVSTVGVSALIQPDGSVLRRSGHFTQQTLLASLPLRTDLTLATRLGAWPEVLLVLIGLAGALMGAGSGRLPAAGQPVAGAARDARSGAR
jgi:apolipoprotein N-acyltransferase